jgi:hypothetical protein
VPNQLWQVSLTLRFIFSKTEILSSVNAPTTRPSKYDPFNSGFPRNNFL